HIGHCCRMERATSISEHNAKLGPANSGGVLQHRLEHARQLAGRARDDAQYLRRRRLLLQRLAEIAGARIELGFQLASLSLEVFFQLGAGFAYPTKARCRLRSGRTNFATASPALGAFGRQGHLDRPVLVVTGRGSALASRNVRTVTGIGIAPRERRASDSMAVTPLEEPPQPQRASARDYPG